MSYKKDAGKRSNKKFIYTVCILTSVAVIGIVAYKLTLNFASDKLMEQVTQQVTQDEVNQIMENPEIRSIVQEHLKTQNQNPSTGQPDVAGQEQIAEGQGKDKQQASSPTRDSIKTPQDASSSPASGSNQATSNQIVFKNKEEALKFVLTKFTFAELQALASKATDGVTSAEKEDIKKTLLSRMTPEEYTALKVIGLIEISKNEQYKDSIK